MDHFLQDFSEQDKNFLIDQLIDGGIYKINNTHLFELCLSDLEKAFNQFVFNNKRL